MGKHKKTSRRTVEKARKSKSSYQKEETAWWCKENGWKKEKQTKGINNY